MEGLLKREFVDMWLISGAYVIVISLSYLSMFPNVKYWKMISDISHKNSIMTTFWLSDVIREDVIYDRSGVLSDPVGTIDHR